MTKTRAAVGVPRSDTGTSGPGDAPAERAPSGTAAGATAQRTTGGAPNTPAESAPPSVPERSRTVRLLDRLPSIRSKLGAVIVFAVAVTILIMYVAVGFALRKSERDRQFRQLLGEAVAVQTLGFTETGAPSRALIKALGNLPNPAVAIDASGQRLAGGMAIPSTAPKALGGSVDTGRLGSEEYIGIPVVRSGAVVGAVYVGHHVEGGGPAGAVAGTFAFVRSVWWQLLLAGAISALIALVAARWLARGMTQPLRDMARATGRMAKGDYSQRVAVASRDEVGQLSDSFNRMAGEMENLERLRRDLVANVSHELKTPISALRAHLENLLDGVEEPNPAVLSVMLRQSERLSRLIDQLLDLSRLETGETPMTLQSVAIGALAERVVGEITVGWPERDIHVRTGIPSDLPPVVADPERIHQVMFNLLDNAFRFTPPGGEVTIRGVREDGFCEVSVEDTGPGIPLEHLGLVFERFYRVDSSRSRDDGGGGTGIGLAIARSIVEAHGGRIWAEPGSAGGARFRFLLPIAGPPVAEPTVVVRGTASNRNGGEEASR